MTFGVFAWMRFHSALDAFLMKDLILMREPNCSFLLFYYSQTLRTFSF